MKIEKAVLGALAAVLLWAIGYYLFGCTMFMHFDADHAMLLTGIMMVAIGFITTACSFRMLHAMTALPFILSFLAGISSYQVDYRLAFMVTGFVFFSIGVLLGVFFWLSELTSAEEHREAMAASGRHHANELRKQRGYV